MVLLAKYLGCSHVEEAWPQHTECHCFRSSCSCFPIQLLPAFIVLCCTVFAATAPKVQLACPKVLWLIICSTLLHQLSKEICRTMSSSLAPALHINGPVRSRYFCRVCCCCCPSSTAASEQRRRSRWGSVSMQHFERCSYRRRTRHLQCFRIAGFLTQLKKLSQFPNSPVRLGPHK